MNKNLFFQYVDNTRDCDTALLNIAVQKGLYRAKNDKPDIKKLFCLAAAYAVTAALCVSLNTAPFKTASESYLLGRSNTIQGSAEALDNYAKDISNSIIKYLGDG